MNSVLKWVGVASALIVAAPALGMAQSVTEPLSGFSAASPLSFSVPSSGGWTVNLTACGGTGLNCANDQVVASVSGATLSLVFDAVGGGNLLTNPGGSPIDVTVNLTVTAPTGQQIYLVSDTLNTAAGLFNVSASESFSTPTENQLSTSSQGTLLASETFAPTTHAITPNLDVVDGGGGAPSSIQSVTLKFSTVPEPVSSSLLAVGFAALGLIRRKVRRAR
jgi:hypothetical protein